MYQYWTDLGLIALNIYSDISLKDGMMSYKEKISGAHKKEIVRIYLYDISRYYEFPFEAVTYREKMMQKGYYIGHYFGDPIKIKVISFNEIHLCAKDYDRVLWSFITKYLITIFCIEKGYLHIKAAVAERNNKAFLIVGRGGSGKTEFLKKLCENGLNYVANTHSIINGNDVFGINTNIRIRNGSQESYISLDRFPNDNKYKIWIPIEKVLWIQFRTDEYVNIEKLSTEVLYQNMKQFSEAIANWELHEDIYDYYFSNIHILADKLQEIDKKLHTMLEHVDKYYVNIDVFNCKSFYRLQELLNII